MGPLFKTEITRGKELFNDRYLLTKRHDESKSENPFQLKQVISNQSCQITEIPRISSKIIT